MLRRVSRLPVVILVSEKLACVTSSAACTASHKQVGYSLRNTCLKSLWSPFMNSTARQCEQPEQADSCLLLVKFRNVHPRHGCFQLLPVVERLPRLQDRSQPQASVPGQEACGEVHLLLQFSQWFCFQGSRLNAHSLNVLASPANSEGSFTYCRLFRPCVV